MELNDGLSEPVVFHKPDTPRPPSRPAVIGSRLFEQQALQK